MSEASPYPCGLRVFLRTHNAETLHYNTHLDGRNILIEERIITIFGSEQKYLGTYFIDAVAFIIPLDTVGPTP